MVLDSGLRLKHISHFEDCSVLVSPSLGLRTSLDAIPLEPRRLTRKEFLAFEPVLLIVKSVICSLVIISLQDDRVNNIRYFNKLRFFGVIFKSIFQKSEPSDPQNIQLATVSYVDYNPRHS